MGERELLESIENMKHFVSSVYRETEITRRNYRTEDRVARLAELGEMVEDVKATTEEIFFLLDDRRDML